MTSRRHEVGGGGERERLWGARAPGGAGILQKFKSKTRRLGRRARGSFTPGVCVANNGWVGGRPTAASGRGGRP